MQSKIGEIYEGKVSGLTSFGAFVRLTNGESGMVHISEVSFSYVKDIASVLEEGQDVRVKVIGVNENGKISLSIKQASEGFRPKPAPKAPQPRPDHGAPRRAPSFRSGAPEEKSGNPSFEDMMAKFKKDSDEKISSLKKNSDFRGGRRGGRS